MTSRAFAPLALAGAVGLMLLAAFSDSIAHAGGKKDNDDKIIAQLRAQLKAKENQIDNLQAALKRLAKEEKGDDQKILQLQKRVNQLEAELKKERKDDAKDQALRKAPFVHTIILKLKDSGDKSAIKSAVTDADNLLNKASGVRGVFAGKADVKDYHVGVVVVFDNAAALRTFLNDPNYKQFAKKMEKSFESPTVFDFHD